MENIISIDWCEDSINRELPWDSSQFIEVKRFNGKQLRKRRALASVFKMGEQGSDDMSLEMATDRVKDFEYDNGIVGYRLKDGRGKIHTFSTDKFKNHEIYDHISGKLEEFVDNLIAEVNKEKSVGVPNDEVVEVSGNSEG